MNSLRIKFSEAEYWKRRCELAEAINEASPCDPDITERQVEAWRLYYSFIKHAQIDDRGENED